jgi:hypothetical protein
MEIDEEMRNIIVEMETLNNGLAKQLLTFNVTNTSLKNPDFDDPVLELMPHAQSKLSPQAEIFNPNKKLIGIAVKNP